MSKFFRGAFEPKIQETTEQCESRYYVSTSKTKNAGSNHSSSCSFDVRREINGIDLRRFKVMYINVATIIYTKDKENDT